MASIGAFGRASCSVSVIDSQSPPRAASLAYCALAQRPVGGGVVVVPPSYRQVICQERFGFHYHQVQFCAEIRTEIQNPRVPRQEHVSAGQVVAVEMIPVTYIRRFFSVLRSAGTDGGHDLQESLTGEPVYSQYPVIQSRDGADLLDPMSVE